jgi:uncharacterized protein YoxC
MKVDTTFTVSNILTIIGMIAAIIIFAISISFTSGANRSDIQELKQSMKEMQTTLNSIDRRTAVLEERTSSGKTLTVW